MPPARCSVIADILLLELIGDPGLEDVQRAVVIALMDPLFRPGVRLVIDVTRSTASRVGDQVAGAVPFLESLRARDIIQRQCAIVSPYEGVVAILTMKRGFRDRPLTFDVFTAMDRAIHWARGLSEETSGEG